MGVMIDGIYVITPGPAAPKSGSRKKDASADGRAGLCPGDSGGPLYRAGGDGLTVVGINANYTFSSGTSSTFDDGKRWHTRVDGKSGLKVGEWLAKQGVSTVCLRGGCRVRPPIPHRRES